MTHANAVPKEKERNAARSREDILDAAERLFAQRGYEGTSLSDVGRAAGLSRATPGYFFGSKADLLGAVLERCFEEVRQAVREGRDRALASGQPSAVILAAAVSDYIDFVAARPNFVRLIQREALGGRPLDALPLGLTAGREMMAALTAELGLEDEDPAEVSQMLFSLIALVWFPHLQGNTLSRVMGLDTTSEEFLARRKKHITELFMGWLAARQTAAAR